MKNKIKLIISFLFVMIISITFASCEKYDYPIDYNLCEFFGSSNGTRSSQNSHHSAKLTIKTGKYNYAGHFRITYDGEEIFNSKDYNYFVPKGTTIYSKILKAVHEDKYFHFELLDHNALMTFRYKQPSGLCYVPVTKNNYRLYSTNSYIETDVCDYKMYFDGNSNMIKKGLTYVLFTTDDEYYLPQFGPLHIESTDDRIKYELVSSQCKDYAGNNYGYMNVKSTVNNYKILDDDVVITPAGEHYDIFLGEGSYTFEFTTNANYVEFTFANLNNDSKKYKISYEFSYKTISQLKNGEVLSESSESKSGEKYENTIELYGVSSAPSSGEILGRKLFYLNNNESFNVDGKLIREYTYKVQVEML